MALLLIFNFQIKKLVRHLRTESKLKLWLMGISINIVLVLLAESCVPLPTGVVQHGAPQFDLGLDNLTEEQLFELQQQLHNDPKEDQEAQSIENHGDDGSDGSDPLPPSALLATLLMPAHSSTTPGPFPPDLAPVPVTPSKPVHESTHGSPGSELARSVFPRVTLYGYPFPTSNSL